MNDQRLSRIGSTHLRIGVVALGCIQLVLITGCRKDEIHAYRVAKENTPDMPAVSQEQRAPSSDVMWAVPASWNEVETTSSMRIATYQTTSGVEVAVTAFPGDVGGLVANVNRWRGQVGLDSTDEQGVEENIERLTGSNVIVVDINGVSSRLIGTIIDVGDGQTWFAKAMGDSESVEQIKSDIVDFSVSFHVHHDSDDHSSPSAPSQTPQAPASSPTLDWTPPPQWKADPDASAILMAAFFADSGARITLTSLSGDGGGLMGNINRWRGQLGMSALQSMDEQPIKDLGDGALIVDLVSSEGAGRILAGIVPVGDQTLFFKMTGSVEETDSEIERFEEFVTDFGLGRKGEP